MFGHEKTIEVSKCWYFVQLPSERKSSAYQLLSHLIREFHLHINWYVLEKAETAVKQKCEWTLGLSLVALLWFAIYTNSDFFTMEQLFVLSTSVHITVLGQSSATPPCQLLWLTNCMTWTTLTLIFLVEDMSLIFHGQHFQGMWSYNIYLLVSILHALRAYVPRFSSQ